MTPGHCSLEVLYGALPLQRLHLPFLAETPVSALTLNGDTVAFDKVDVTITFEARTKIKAGQTLQVLYSKATQPFLPSAAFEAI